ncbi:uncharacterized protein K452DRAFT_10441 [Aplosporella prunicola CBS 121167]|uniref:Uncharacterized protein n=1 Tax=Aplosporella prunicola CBS 121167 TaxID=1176127 RepID=A0A6A6BHF7_9PEZI|nr:uncharacterized protein K452DRAFT_10441 [Aplosporella prunicola CBS 121167]KAF2142765.1 hypothetical protein K452DRAFT_10441 [Aplosporella prunicola CBS 121167]
METHAAPCQVSVMSFGNRGSWWQCVKVEIGRSAISNNNLGEMGGRGGGFSRGRAGSAMACQFFMAPGAERRTVYPPAAPWLKRSMWAPLAAPQHHQLPARNNTSPFTLSTRRPIHARLLQRIRSSFSLAVSRLHRGNLAPRLPSPATGCCL